MVDELLPQHEYKIPSEGVYSISFSGGRSSAYMLHRILEANNGLPSNAVVCFANTGKEHPLTLDFVHEVGVRWGVKIAWLEYWFNEKARGGVKDPKHCHRVVNHNSACRGGEPYKELIVRRGNADSGGYLPNKVQRLCTQELKVNTMARYLRRDMGWRNHKAFIGIRYDEPRRWKKALITTDCNNLYPMVTDKTTRGAVLRFWRGQDFDLKTPELYGNCDLCYLKGRRKLIEAIKLNPSYADWWIEQEDMVLENGAYVKGDEKNARFRYDESYRQLREAAGNEQTLWEGKMAVPADEPIDCFCGD